MTNPTPQDREMAEGPNSWLAAAALAGYRQGIEDAARVAEGYRDGAQQYLLENGANDPAAYDALKMAANILGAIRKLGEA